ncbi:unnamed protein product [Macrosiphum euphorbiae]|uniref:RNase H type-1 domain-containing protein n=1 Tax=Macrosiphum euphorbiae TaxID=13131 RepID=A0AAV0X6P7_9HEMI|nr:unnamed protein product [Macrosiphum euphorbiae]
MWVPSHTGFNGNEEVDLLANQAISSTESTVRNSLPYKDLSRIINLISNKQWQSQWDRTSDIKLKNMKKTIQKWRSPINTTRNADIVTTTARIGHTHLTHSFLFNHDEHPTCHQCDLPLTIEHLTLSCTKYNHERSILNFLSNIEEALGETNTDAIFNFFNAIKVSNLL